MSNGDDSVNRGEGVAPAAVDPVEEFAWVGTGKTIQQLAAERVAFMNSLDPGVRSARDLGTYWTPIESVFAIQSLRFEGSDFDAICRTELQGAVYRNTYDHLNLAARKSDKSSTQTHSISNNLKVDLFGNFNAQGAHLLSDAPLCHKAYGFTAEGAVGKRASDDTCSLMPFQQTGAAKRSKIMKGVEGKHFSSLKGHPFNKLYLKAQADFYDREPSLILVPLLPLHDILGWATDAAHGIDYDVAAFVFGERSQEAGIETLSHAPAECNAADLVLAQQNLRSFVLGLAGCILEKNVKEGFTQTELDGSTLKSWSELVDSIKAGNKATINVPERLVQPSARVAKGRITSGTSLCDPWLLLLKAAVNFSVMEGCKLMPACRPDVDDGIMFSTQDPESSAFVAFVRGETATAPDHVELLRDSLLRGGTTTELFSDGTVVCSSKLEFH